MLFWDLFDAAAVRRYCCLLENFEFFLGVAIWLFDWKTKLELELLERQSWLRVFLLCTHPDSGFFQTLEYMPRNYLMCFPPLPAIQKWIPFSN